MFISDYLKTGIKGHANFDFVDIYLEHDNRLFIDPCLIQKSTDLWSITANKKIRSYFDCLYDAFRVNSNNRRDLLSHAGEQNATKLGYGNGLNGKGKTPDGMLCSLRGLSMLIRKIPTIGEPIDLSVLIRDFGEDNMSDLLTNIIHEDLNAFTQQQLNKWGYTDLVEVEFWSWDMESKEWKKFVRPSCMFNGREILLVPKWIVRKNYLVSIHQYFYTIILDKIREENYQDWTKKDIFDNIRRESKTWEYDNAIMHTFDNPKLLSKYHERVPKHYNRAYGSMTDEDLDVFIYKRNLGNIA